MPRYARPPRRAARRGEAPGRRPVQRLAEVHVFQVQRRVLIGREQVHVAEPPGAPRAGNHQPLGAVEHAGGEAGAAVLVVRAALEGVALAAREADGREERARGVGAARAGELLGVLAQAEGEVLGPEAVRVHAHRARAVGVGAQDQALAVRGERGEGGPIRERIHQHGPVLEAAQQRARAGEQGPVHRRGAQAPAPHRGSERGSDDGVLARPLGGGVDEEHLVVTRGGEHLGGEHVPERGGTGQPVARGTGGGRGAPGTPRGLTPAAPAGR